MNWRCFFEHDWEDDHTISSSDSINVIVQICSRCGRVRFVHEKKSIK